MNKNVNINLSRIIGAIILSVNSPTLFGQEHLNTEFVTTWTASPQAVWDDSFIFPPNIPKLLEDQTVRQAIKVSLGGDKIQIELSNAHGDSAVNLRSVTVGIPISSEHSYALNKIVNVTFDGKQSATILPGSSLLSDELTLAVDDLSELVISFYIPDRVKVETFHWDGRQTNYIASGNQTQSQNLSGELYETTARLFVSGIYVGRQGATTLAVIGDSITDGATASLNKNARWTDFLAKRLKPLDMAVINAGISGARLLSDGMGSNAISRLQRDVLSKPGVSSLIVLLGINDISWPGTLFAPDQELPDIEQLKAGLIQLVKQAHLQGVSVIGATLPPFEGALQDTPIKHYYSDAKNQLRLTLNDWIKNSLAFDEVIDFDSILRDPKDVNRINPAYDSGDHLHPGDAGNKAMAYGIEIKKLNDTSQKKVKYQTKKGN